MIENKPDASAAMTGLPLPPPATRIRRILVMAYGHIADTLPAAPCLAALRATYPSAQIHMLVVSEVAALWRACPYVDRVHVMRDFRWKGTRLARLERGSTLAWLTLRLRNRYDLALVLHARSPFFTRLAYLSRAAYRAGFSDYGPDHWLTHPADPVSGIISFREENRRVLHALGITRIDRHLHIWPTDQAQQEVDRLLGRDAHAPLLVGIHPGSHWACQRWHNDRWAAVADAITERYNARIVITGSPDEHQLALDIALRMRTRPLIAAGATSLLGFAALVARCRVLLCVNSAASQVALATDTPVINLVGLEPLTWTQPEPDETMSVVQQTASSPDASWCPLGIWGRLSQCQRGDHVGWAGLDSIQPEHVLAAVAGRLQPQPATAASVPAQTPPGDNPRARVAWQAPA